MLARCVTEFRDLKAEGKPLRKVGDEFEATAERIAEINSAGYGVMAEEKPAEAEEKPSEAPKPAGQGKTATRRKTTAKKAE